MVTFFSFMVCSAVPMLAYVFCFVYNQQAALDYLFWISIALFALTLFVLGAVKLRATCKHFFCFFFSNLSSSFQRSHHQLGMAQVGHRDADSGSHHDRRRLFYQLWL